MECRLSGWQRAQALAAEGLCLLWWLVPGALQLLWLWLELPLPHRLLLPLGAAALQGLLLSPCRLTRLAGYCRLAGCPCAPPTPRLWPRAVTWRWGLWWRRSALLLAAVAPATALWHYGAAAANPILWLPLGAAAGLLGLMGAGVVLCRYAAAPLLILQGYPAGAALGLSPRVMRGHIRAYLNFLGRRSWRLAACLAVVPIPWVLPAFGTARAALLAEWCSQTVPPGAV